MAKNAQKWPNDIFLLCKYMVNIQNHLLSVYNYLGTKVWFNEFLAAVITEVMGLNPYL